ncbi:3'-5' exonuclease [Pontibacillus halophilus]|uniref:3'-5' exonuclease n=1 Tax=Pontibacillus halophilus TaxID=516704 RepID=UPI001E49D903|nr:exonuclease domain-containing protein [Pontibacillus halophilus]
MEILKYIFFEKHIYAHKIKPYLQGSQYELTSNQIQSFEQDSSMLDVPLSEVPFTIFDLETTGLLPEVGHEIISIGAVKITGTDAEVGEGFHQQVRPIRPVTKLTLELTGLDEQDLNQSPPFIEGLSNFLTFSENSIWVAHPARFDLNFLQVMLKRWKLPSLAPLSLDTHAVAKALYPEENHQLDALIQRFGIQQLVRHFALNDAIMTAELLTHLIAELQNRGIHTIRDIYTHLYEK